MDTKKRVFLDEFSVKEIVANKHTKIYIFGVCAEAENAAKFLSDYADIKAFVDNNKSGKNNLFLEKNIISVEQFLSYRGDAPIIIATNRFANVIVEQLKNYGLIRGKDIYVWDSDYIHHSDDRVEKIINVFSTLWTNSNKRNSDNVILIPFDNFHVPAIIKYAYCSNYMANKYDANIYGYCWLNFSKTSMSETISRIYQAFGVIDTIDTALDTKQQNEVHRLLVELWPHLNTWGDWNNIKIYDIHFGTTLLRDFFRRYIPPFNVHCEQMKDFLIESLNAIVFWYDYFKTHNVKTVIMSDGSIWEGYIRDIAISSGILVYAVNSNYARLTLDFSELSMYQYFDEMWNLLTKEEQEYGKEWAKKRIQKRISGNVQDVALVDKKNFAFSAKQSKKRILHENDKLKLLICPHSFEEDSYWYGEHIFDNNYFSWLCHLGDLSERYSNYEWYLKPHPTASQRDNIIIDSILRKYHKILKLPKDISPIQLRDEGIEYALTVCGTIGHEYPAIGIQVINAGLNPHSKFDFCWNPKTKEEFDDLIHRLKDRPKKENMEELYAFYAMKYLYYDWNYVSEKIRFFDNPLLDLTRKGLRAKGYGTGPWVYEEYIKEFSMENHEKISNKMEALFKILDEKKPEVFYKKHI